MIYGWAWAIPKTENRKPKTVLMSVRPGFVVPLLDEIIITVPLELPVGHGALELDFPVIHADDFPIAAARPAFHENFLAHLKGKGPENVNLMTFFLFCHT
jgi:hypothetical protein